MTGFKGQRDVIVDSKGRITIPMIFRDPLLEECDGELTITRHLHADCLVAYKRPDWGDVESELDELKNGSIQFSKIDRRIRGNAEDIQIDKAGRVLIPKDLRKRAFIDKKVTVIGLGTLLEIWDRDLLEEASVVELDPTDPETIRLTNLLKL